MCVCVCVSQLTASRAAGGRQSPSEVVDQSVVPEFQLERFTVRVPPQGEGFRGVAGLFPRVSFSLFFFFLLFKTEFGSHGSKGRRRLSRCSRIHLTCSTIWDSLILKGSKKKTKNNLFLFGSKSVPGVTISKVSQDSVSVPNSMSTSRFVFQNQVPVSPSCPPR